MPPTPAFYTARADAHAAEAARLQARYNRLAVVRLLAFVAAVALVILAGSRFGILGAGPLALLLLGGFGLFVNFHQRIARARDHARRLERVNRDEAAFQTHDWSVFADGVRYLDPAHPYTVDLDVFGPHSLFQFFNRTATVIGADRLAGFLRDGTDRATTRTRQTAVQDLTDRLDFRQELRARGLDTADDPRHVQQLLDWLNDPPYVLGNAGLTALLWLIPLVTITALVLAVIYLPYQLWLLALVPAGIVLARTTARVSAIHARTEAAGGLLSAYAEQLVPVEQEPFTAPPLVALQAAFRTDPARPASRHIRRLAFLVRQLNVRSNPFAILLNVFSLWDLRYVRTLEQWRAAQRTDLPRWFDALAELEALASLATVAYNRPAWTFPTLTDTQQLDGRSLGHPLLPETGRITNHLATPTRSHIKLVTGSNMAGKSTWLRTVGLNIVLARAGAPVCAAALTLPPLDVYTSMRTQDALHESTSSFYAELKRLQFIIAAVEAGRPVYFLLDEILKGTNSRDRHTGSKALIRQLTEAGGAGIIATHDLELGTLEAQYGGQLENWRMEVGIDGDRLTFNYQLERGVSESFNATVLMRRMGIRIGTGDTKR